MLAAMGALKDLWQSERGLVTIALLTATTVLVITGNITPEQWLEYTKWAFMAYIASKTVTGAVQIATSAPSPDPAPTSTIGAVVVTPTAPAVVPTTPAKV